MRKVWKFALKEIKVTFRDVGALVSMILTPLALTLAVGAAFGTSDATLSDIPVLLLNQDEGQVSNLLVEVFESEQVQALVDLEIVEDESAARARVDVDEVAALVVIPAGFSAKGYPIAEAMAGVMGTGVGDFDEASFENLAPEQQQDLARTFLQVTQQDRGEPVEIEIYGSPNWQISVAVVRGILTQGLEQINIVTEGLVQVSFRLFSDVAAGEGNAIGETLQDLGGELQAAAESGDLPVGLRIVSGSGRNFNWLDYSATSMAVLFLMFAATAGGRTLLAERQQGTLPRLLITPTPPLTILVGKMSGIALSGLLQVSVLWAATSLLGAYWGPPLAVVSTLVGLVIFATGVGALISAWAETPVQAGTIGSAFSLIGAAVSGSFLPRPLLPDFLQLISYVTPHAWGIEIFSRLQAGRGFEEVLPLLGGMVILTIVYYAAALFGFRRQFA